MTRTKPRLKLGLVLAAALLLAAACNGKATPTPKPALPSSPSPSPVGEKGDYSYNDYGISATLTPDGDSWDFEIQNKTGQGIAKPGIYVLDARDGQRIDATVEGSAPMNTGQSKEYTVTFPPEFDPKNVGLVLLQIGSADWGAFAPPLL
ncbi:MAG: hypothetical protein WD757_09595 [Actinomycetota bacterium]